MQNDSFLSLVIMWYTLQFTSNKNLLNHSEEGKILIQMGTKQNFSDSCDYVNILVSIAGMFTILLWCVSLLPFAN